MRAPPYPDHKALPVSHCIHHLLPVSEQRQAAQTEYEPTGVDRIGTVASAARDHAVRYLVAQRWPSRRG